MSVREVAEDTDQGKICVHPIFQHILASQLH